MLGAFIIALVLMAPSLLKGKREKPVFTLGLTLVAIFVVAIMLPGGSSIIERFHEGNLGTLNGRTLVWNRALDYFGDGSILHQLIGYGLSSGQVILPSHLTDDLWNFHNQYLAWLVEEGFLGLMVFFAFLLASGASLSKVKIL